MTQITRERYGFGNFVQTILMDKDELVVEIVSDIYVATQPLTSELIYYETGLRETYPNVISALRI